MTDEEGMATESYDVTIKNACTTTVKYDVINSLNNNTLADSHVKVGVENNISLLTKNTTVETTVDTATKAYKIGDGIIAPDSEQK